MPFNYFSFLPTKHTLNSYDVCLTRVFLFVLTGINYHGNLDDPLMDYNDDDDTFN